MWCPLRNEAILHLFTVFGSFVYFVSLFLCHIHALIGPAQIFWNSNGWNLPIWIHPFAMRRNAQHQPLTRLTGERRFSPGTCWAVPWFGRKHQRIWRGWCPVIPCNLAMEKWCKNSRFLESCWKNGMSSYHWFCGFVCYREIHLNNRGEKSWERKRQSIAVHLQTKDFSKTLAARTQFEPEESLVLPGRCFCPFQYVSWGFAMASLFWCKHRYSIFWWPHPTSHPMAIVLRTSTRTMTTLYLCPLDHATRGVGPRTWNQEHGTCIQPKWTYIFDYDNYHNRLFDLQIIWYSDMFPI